MILRKLFHSPLPPNAFAIGETELLFGQLNRQRTHLSRVAAAEIVDPWYQLGPVGILHIERHALVAALGALLKQLEKPVQRASLVIPNSWIRSLVVEVGTLPRQREEAEEVLRWRLKKLLPCRPEEVRLDYVGGSDKDKVVVLLALDRPLTVVEDAFLAAGISIGRIEPAVIAMAELLPPSPNPCLLISVEERALALVLMAAGNIVLVRQKALPADISQAVVLLARELSRTLVHTAELNLGEQIEIWLASPPGELAEAFEQWIGERSDVVVQRLIVGHDRVPAVAGVPAVRVWPLLAVATDGSSS